MRAAIFNHRDVVVFLLSRKANANIRNQVSLFRVIDICVQFRKTTIACAYEGLTASNLAQSEGHHDLAELLRAHETD